MTDILTHDLVPSDDAVESRVGDETVILHMGNGTYYGLDPLGTRIWGMIKDGQRPDAIKIALLAEFDVAPEVLEADMRRFLADLIAHDILVTAPG